jgi:hypothetical protein
MKHNIIIGKIGLADQMFREGIVLTAPSLDVGSQFTDLLNMVVDVMTKVNDGIGIDLSDAKWSVRVGWFNVHYTNRRSRIQPSVDGDGRKWLALTELVKAAKFVLLGWILFG